LAAREQLRPDVARKRELFAIARRFVDADRFVWLDESAARCHMTRLYGWSEGGSRCVDFTPAGHWRTYTMLAAMRSNGVVAEASLLADEAMTGDLFVAWARQSLAPTLSSGDVVVMDNLNCHKVAGVEEAIEAAGASVWYLPPYSPDLNPIEKAWSKVKAFLGDHEAATPEELEAAVGEALASVTAEDCLGFLRSCGYDS
jgi:hypothetical protein